MLTRPLLFASTVVATLGLAASPVAAKGIKSARICGTNHCVDADVDRDDETMIFGGSASGPPAKSTAKAEGFYRLEIAIGARDIEERLMVEVLPQAGYMRSEDNIAGSEWRRMTARQKALFRPLIAGLEAFPASKLEGLSNPPLPVANASRPSPSQPAEPADDGVGMWVWVLAGVGGAVTAAVVVRRRRRRPAPAPRLS